MAYELEKTQSIINKTLNDALDKASAIITKDYLARLETFSIVEPSEEDTDIDIAECGKFCKLTKLVLNREENFLNKLTTIVNVASSIDCSLATVINSDGQKINFYFGIISKNARGSRENSKERRRADAAAFMGALTGNLIGSDISDVSADEINAFKETTLEKKNSFISSVSGIVALRDGEEDKKVEGYVQGIENLVDSLKGLKYTIVMLADPIDTTEIRTIKQGYEIMHTELSTLARSTVTMNESDTMSLSKSRTDGITNGISKGISMTQSKSKSTGKSSGIGFSLVLSLNSGRNSGTSESTGRTDSYSSNASFSKSSTDTVSSSKATGKSIQISYENRSAKTLLERIDANLKRLDLCESFGAFDCASYVIADDKMTALTVAGNYNALMRGKTSCIQASHINTWYKPEDTKILSKYIGSLVHPRFFQGNDNSVRYTPASIISGNELAMQIGLPKKSVFGITVIPMAPFGRNIADVKSSSMVLGKLNHMGHDESENGDFGKVSVDIDSLTMHTFITGSTGSGKSTAIYSILDKLKNCNVNGKDEKIKFLVIEPAKGEYKDRFGYYSDVSVYGTNYKKMPLLRINPFSFPNDIHVLEHIDRLIEIFNVCWPMYAAMPAVLKDAIERAYIISGWNLETSECKYRNAEGIRLYPSFTDVLNQINNVMEESAYSSDSKGDYKGALCTRLKSLTNGLYGQIFTSDELTSEELFDKNVIVDLSRTGSSETKALIMGLLVMKLQEHRMANASGGNSPLKHITVLEEAHNILKRTSTEQTNEGANLLGKSVEMLANSIAEMRTYGEGFVIADQAPELMDLSVIRNTNTKIILRLPDFADRNLVGKAASLNDDQIAELSRLKTFVAAVYQNNWLEPVLCNIDTNFKEVRAYNYKCPESHSTDADIIISFLLMPLDNKNKLDSKYITNLTNAVFKMQISSEIKADFLKYVKTADIAKEKMLRSSIVYSYFNSKEAINLAKVKEDSIDEWYKYMKIILKPSIDGFDEIECRKIISIIAREYFNIEKTEKSKDLFNSLMNYL